MKVSGDFGGKGLVPIMGGHHPSFAEVVCAVGKPDVLLGKGKELQVFVLMGKTQYALEAGFLVRGSAFSPSRVAEGNIRVSFPSGASIVDESA